MAKINEAQKAPVHAVITIRADHIEDNGNGTFKLFIPSRVLTTTEAQILEDLFPNLLESAYWLLTKEALISNAVRKEGFE